MKNLDYQHPLTPDWRLPTQINKNGMLSFDTSELPELTNVTVLLEFHYTSSSKKKMGHIEMSHPDMTPEGREHQQYYEAGQKGRRYLNLSQFSDLASVKLKAIDCQMDSDAHLLFFTNPSLEQGPTLIIAPHADDAELAAYGLYAKWHRNIWIVTLYAGETLQKLDKQYIPGLDNSIETGIQRKAAIRNWNSMTTPLLAGVPENQLVYLGYTGVTVENLLNEPEKAVTYGVGQNVNPTAFRRLNRISLSNDLVGENSPRAMVSELAELLTRIQPVTVLVTDPEVDPHFEHRAAALALAMAMEQSQYHPRHVLMYVNHLRGIRDFPYGPEHTNTALAPFFSEYQKIKQVKVFSHHLTLEEQKAKVVSFNTMHDLKANLKFDKKLKRWWKEKRFGYGYRYYGNHTYFQTHIKAAEVFTVVEGLQFQQQLLKTTQK